MHVAIRFFVIIPAVLSFVLPVHAQTTPNFTIAYPDSKHITVSGTGYTAASVTVCLAAKTSDIGAKCTEKTTISKVDAGLFTSKSLKALKGQVVGVLVGNTLTPSTAKTVTSAPAASSQGNQTTFRLDASQSYCDASLPYTYSYDDKGKLRIEVQAKDEKWSAYLQQNYDAKVSTGPGKGIVSFVSSTNSFSVLSGIDDPWDNNNLYDSGGSILGDSTHTLSTDTLDAQRLLVRSVFGPNPFSIACAYPYLNSEPPSGSSEPLDVNGNPIEIIQAGAGYPFSIKSKDAPQYYLINIVRWQDAKAAAGSAPSSDATSVPYFQATDEWYLLNYSDRSDIRQDVTKWHKFNPSLDSQTMQILGSSRVMFIGIHLAPMPQDPKSNSADPSAAPTAPPTWLTAGLPAPATEQAWFDDTPSIKYSFEADAAQAANMADLNTLISILLSNVGVTQPAATPQASGGTPSATNFAQEVFAKTSLFAQNAAATLDSAKADLDQATKQLNADCTAHPERCSSPLWLYLHQLQDPTKLLASANQDEAVVVDRKSSDATSQINTLEADAASITTLDEAIMANKAILSTYQGRYGAGIITNLKSLPVNLTGTWTATFTSTTSSSGDNVSYAAPTLLSIPANCQTTPYMKDSDGGGCRAPIVSPAAASVSALPQSPDQLVTLTSDRRIGGPSPEMDFSSSQQTHASGDKAPATGGGSKKTANAAAGGGNNVLSTSKNTVTQPAATTTTTTASNSTYCTIQSQAGTNGKTQVQQPCIHKGATVLDEGTHYWDISAAVGIPGYQSLTFVQGTGGGNNTVAGPSITRTNAYGLLDVFVIPENLQNPPTIGFPHLFGGLPFSGKVFDKPYVGVGETLTVPKSWGSLPLIKSIPALKGFFSANISLRPAFGWVINKETQQLSTGPYTRRAYDPQFAIEISLSKVTNAISTLGKGSSSKNSTTTNANATSTSNK